MKTDFLKKSSMNILGTYLDVHIRVTQERCSNKIAFTIRHRLKSLLWHSVAGRQKWRDGAEVRKNLLRRGVHGRWSSWPPRCQGRCLPRLQTSMCSWSPDTRQNVKTLFINKIIYNRKHIPSIYDNYLRSSQPTRHVTHSCLPGKCISYFIFR